MGSGRSLRVVFFGTPAFAVPTLDELLHSRHHVVGIVTQPDRPSGRGQRTIAAPVKARAIAAGLPILQPDKMKDPAFLASLAGFDADIGVVAAYGRILTEAMLAIPPLGMVNVHASLLPRYRGAAPVHRAVMNGETETGVTIMRVVKALDAGAMLATAGRAIGPDETSDIVERDLAAVGAPLLRETLDRLADGPVEERTQDEAQATYAPRLTRDDGIVDWSRTAAAIHNQIRGLHPWPHAFSFLGGRRVILRRSSLSVDGGSSPPGIHGAPGTIVAASGGDLTVSTGVGTIRIIELQPEGKRPLRAREFLAGHRLAPGDRFMPDA
jgi:methionyl-tRNA formyltransferase